MTPGFEKQAANLCAYIVNTGQVPLRTVDFDDDWSPAGQTYRDELLESELIEIWGQVPEEGEQGGIVLTAAGKALAQTSALLARQHAEQA